ncbi:SUF system Fe-S cluster assembly regulator [Aquibaculum arenosum]|uniref:SUF system Fe-S cluster assembly regulator n=1 Tax=Aquibaculum arenosum TaxID=3032591 RepID=A0ABT5YRA7_9PROT|nr:SUF system Fe-S cluster assembly regulator [Fodinicurvata sp. CAU 1616]MDF2097417.1 SUF system Fe-S cluster assembly regulator [Fodinicurvata sp. CAU 1616]
MFRLNRLTDYAVVVMARMANDGCKVRTAPQIAEDTGVPLPTVAKVLNALARDGLIVSQRGASGGYRLGAPPERITVAAIIQALEGPIALTACVDGQSGHCESESLCPMRGNWDRVNNAIRGALEGVTLEDMTAGLFVPMGERRSPAALQQASGK